MTEAEVEVHDADLCHACLEILPPDTRNCGHGFFLHDDCASYCVDCLVEASREAEYEQRADIDRYGY